MKGTSWGFAYMAPLKETKPVAESEGADSRAHFGPLDIEKDATILGKKGFGERYWVRRSIHGSFERNQNTGPK